MTDEPLPIPHRCGAICGFCTLRDGYKILFCDICKKVVGCEKDGIRLMKQETQYKQKEYSDETLNNSV